MSDAPNLVTHFKQASRQSQAMREELCEVLRDYGIEGKKADLVHRIFYAALRGQTRWSLSHKGTSEKQAAFLESVGFKAVSIKNKHGNTLKYLVWLAEGGKSDDA